MTRRGKNVALRNEHAAKSDAVCSHLSTTKPEKWNIATFHERSTKRMRKKPSSRLENCTLRQVCWWFNFSGTGLKEYSKITQYEITGVPRNLQEWNISTFHERSAKRM